MDIKEIKRIIELMKENEISDFEMEQEGLRLCLKRQGDGGMPVAMPVGPAPLPMAAIAPVAAPAADAAAPVPVPREEDAELADIKSPIVGTFYRAPSPEAEPFVSLGQEVDEDTVVCIIEAMKVMNEIKAECRGIIRKIAVENATAVQFGQALFKIEPL